MKPIVGILAAAVLLAVTACGYASGIKWNTDLAKALQIAKKSKKPVMVDFYGES